MVKAPRTPPATLLFQSDDFVSYSGPLFRIYATEGSHPTTWNEFRDYGPLQDKRWEPHPVSLGHHPGHGVMYAASHWTTSFAKVFQETRRISLTQDARRLAGWSPTRPLRLLQARGGFLTRQGASAALQHGQKSTTRAWAQAIFAQAPLDVDGMLVDSTMQGECLVLWERTAASALPTAPTFEQSLSDPALAPMIRTVRRETNFTIGR